MIARKTGSRRCALAAAAEDVSAGASNHSNVHVSSTDRAAFRQIAAMRFLRLCCQLALFPELFVPRHVGLVERALRMNAIPGIRSLATIRTQVLRLLRDKGYRLENAHIAPDCKSLPTATRPIESTTATRHVACNIHSSRVNGSNVDNLSTLRILREIVRSLRFALAGTFAICNNEPGLVQRTCICGRFFCVGWLLFFQPHLLAGLQLGPLSSRPRKCNCWLYVHSRFRNAKSGKAEELASG
jgi:hypothetical protein